MPFVRIDHPAGQPDSYRNELSDAVARSLTQAFGTPANDRFQVITEHPVGRIIADQRHVDIDGTDQTIIIQAYINTGRTTNEKKSLYNALAAQLNGALGVRKQDIIITLVEVTAENWSFGNGEAQYA